MNIALIGYGKMGRIIEEILIERGHNVAGKFTEDEPANIEKLTQADVAIEFTHPESAIRNIEICFEAGVPVVVGTTGWYDDFEMVKSKCMEGEHSLLHATNFSLGVNLFFKLNEVLAELMNSHQDYDIKLSETHHTEKKDAPSGTALSLAEGILTKVNRKSSWINGEANNKEELEIVSYRTPNVPGTHTITYSSAIDDIEITHQAHNRRGFALGSVIAAEWLVDKTGVYTMKDVLNL